VSKHINNDFSIVRYPNESELTHAGALFAIFYCLVGVVHQIFHKSELSLHAVIKFFAAGFLIAFPTVFIFEWIIINCWLAIAFSLDATFGIIIGNSYTNWIDTNYRGLLIVAEICLFGYGLKASLIR